MTAAPPPAPEHLDLAVSFESVDRARWQAAVAAVLRRSGRLPEDATGEQAEAALTQVGYDGFAIRPLYTADDAPAERPGSGAEAITRSGGWDIRARHAHPDPATSRAAVLDDLQNGISSLWLVLGAGGIAVADLSEVLAGVHLDLAPVILDAGEQAGPAADALFELAAASGLAADRLIGNLGVDPFGLRARRGPGIDLVAGLELARMLAQRCLQSGPGLRAITVDATGYHDAGGSDATELACAAATGLGYLRALTGPGLTIEEAFGQLEFRFAATADQFATIAKLRAARRLWARVGEVCQVPGPAAVQRQHAVSSTVMITRRDPWVNLLRGTVACLAAGVAGADAVTVQPFDAALGLPDELARRMARNTSSLLVLESNVARVADPAAGSWYVERRTADLAAAAWQQFTAIEQAGGIAAALDSGLIREQIDRVWKQRADHLAHRRDPLTGVSQFPDPDELELRRQPAPAAVQSAGGLPIRRYAAAFESLRDAADAAAGRGHRPVVFLATLGTPAGYTARAGFAANLFGAGGLDTPSSGPGTDPDAIAAAFAGSGARVACLAAGDREYREHGTAVAQALKAVGARRIWLVGRPAEPDHAGIDGVDGHVGPGVDAVALLRQAHELSGVSGVSGTKGAAG